MKKKVMVLLGIIIGLAVVAMGGNGNGNGSGTNGALKTADVRGGFIYNHGVINPDVVGMTFTNVGIRDVTVSAGQLSGVDPETGAVITNSANLLSLKAQSLETTGDMTAGGQFVGNGFGLTNLNAVTTETDPTVPSSIKDGITWSEISDIPADIADGDDVLSETEVDSMIANNGYALQTQVNTNAADITSLNSSFNGQAERITGLESQTNNVVLIDGSRAMQADLDMGGKKLVNASWYIPPQGDLLMGSYTNGLPQ